MTDIVERLRQTAHLHAVRPQEHCCWEAAAEIERLRAALRDIRQYSLELYATGVARAALTQEKPND